jgi:dissimilatory sulfite reductase related protein
MEEETLQAEQLDNDGFMHKGEDWSEKVAKEIAERNDLGPLTKEHWKIIKFVRKYYADKREGPPIVKISKATGMTSKEICNLFPCGVAKGAYRLAGLPRPTGCL